MLSLWSVMWQREQCKFPYVKENVTPLEELGRFALFTLVITRSREVGSSSGSSVPARLLFRCSSSSGCDAFGQRFKGSCYAHDLPRCLPQPSQFLNPWRLVEPELGNVELW